MKMLLAIGGLGLVIAIAITLLVVRSARRSRRNEETLRKAQEEARRHEERARVEAEARHRGEEEARRRAEAARAAASEAEALRRAQEELRREEEARASQAEARRRAEEEARAAAEQEAQRRAEEDSRRKAEEARVAVEAEAQRQAEEEERRRADEQARASQAEARHRAEEEARVAAEQEAQWRAEEEARRKREEARLTAEAEAQRQAEEESRREAEAEARRCVEEQVRVAAEAEARHTADEEARLNAEAHARRMTEEESWRESVDEARLGPPSPSPVAVSISGGLGMSASPNAPSAPIRTPHQFRPVARAPSVPSAPRTPVSASVERETRERALLIDVRLVFEKAGFCRVSLLPRRAPGMPVELPASGSGDPLELVALQDDWYQDVVLPNTGKLLRDGIEWAGTLSVGQHVRWSLSGRDIYVLARHDELNGFVNAPRLILGEEQVVLCAAERLAEVRSAIALTGSPEPVLLGSDSGVTEGWVGVRGVVPQASIVPSPDGDILDALRPLAEVEIALEGGIRIERQTWLSGFPPRIRLRGDVGAIGAVVIDGCDATLIHDGGYVVPGWDSLGDHSVWCTSGSRTYAIREGVENWQPWDAYTWSLGEPAADGADLRPAICGVLVRPPRLAHADGRAIVVPVSNPVLIGAAPGEIEFCVPRGDVRAGLCVGFPWFEPVWAIPADALHCDKRFARVLLIGTPRAVAEDEQQPNVRAAERRRRAQGPGVYAWYAAIRMAGRKGLQTAPQQSGVADLWKAYKERAKALWRSMR